MNNETATAIPGIDDRFYVQIGVGESDLYCVYDRDAGHVRVAGFDNGDDARAYASRRNAEG